MASAVDTDRLPQSLPGHMHMNMNMSVQQQQQQHHMQQNLYSNSNVSSSFFSNPNHSSEHMHFLPEQQHSQQQDASPSAQLLRFLDDSLVASRYSHQQNHNHQQHVPQHESLQYSHSHENPVSAAAPQMLPVSRQHSLSMQRQGQTQNHGHGQTHNNSNGSQQIGHGNALSPSHTPSPTHSHSNSQTHLPVSGDFHSLLNDYPSHSQHHSRVHSANSQSQLALSDDEANGSYMQNLHHNQHFLQNHAGGNDGTLAGQAAPLQFRQPMARHGHMHHGMPNELSVSSQHSPSDSYSLNNQLEQQVSPRHAQFREHAHSLSSGSPSPASLQSVSPPPVHGANGTGNGGVDLLPSVSPLANSSGVDWVCVCGNVNYGSRARCNMRRCQKTRAEGEIALILGGNAVAQTSKAKHSNEEKFPMQDSAGGITLIPTGNGNSQRPFQGELINSGGNTVGSGVPPTASKVIAITQPKILPLNMFSNSNSRADGVAANSAVIPMNSADPRLRLQQERSPRSPITTSASLSSSPSPLNSARADDNMWTCPRCGNRNYPHRQRCNLRKCGAERPKGIVSASVGSMHGNVDNLAFNNLVGSSVTRPHLRESSAPSPSSVNPLSLHGLQHSLQRFSDDVVKEDGNDWKQAYQQMTAAEAQHFSLQDNISPASSALQQMNSLSSNSPAGAGGAAMSVGASSGPGAGGAGAMSIWICKWCNNANYGYRSVCNMRKCRKPRVDSQEAAVLNAMTNFGAGGAPGRMSAKSDSTRELVHNSSNGNAFIVDTTAKTMALANHGNSANGNSHAQLYLNDGIEVSRSSGGGLHRQLTPEESESRQQHHYSHSHSHSHSQSQSLSYSRSIASFSDDDQLELDSATSPLQWHSDSDAEQLERNRRLFSSDSVTSSRSASGSASESDALANRRLQHGYPLVSSGSGISTANSHGYGQSQSHSSISPSASSINLGLHERLQSNSHSSSPLVSPLVYPRVAVGGALPVHPQTARLPSSRTESSSTQAVHLTRGSTAPLHSLMADQDTVRSVTGDGSDLPELLRTPPSSLHSPIGSRSSNTILESLDGPLVNQLVSANSSSLPSVQQINHSQPHPHSLTQAHTHTQSQSHSHTHNHPSHTHAHAHYSLSSIHYSLPPKTSKSPPPTTSSSSSPSPSPAPLLAMQHSINAHSSYYSAPNASIHNQHQGHNVHSQHFQTPSSGVAVSRPSSNSNSNSSSADRLSDGDSLHPAMLSALHGRMSAGNSHANIVPSVSAAGAYNGLQSNA